MLSRNASADRYSSSWEESLQEPSEELRPPGLRAVTSACERRCRTRLMSEVKGLARILTHSERGGGGGESADPLALGRTSKEPWGTSIDLHAAQKGLSLTAICSFSLQRAAAAAELQQ
ncbi:hypothetical protein AOLI_G00041510 [Acnodon oligacanthus]